MRPGCSIELHAAFAWSRLALGSNGCADAAYPPDYWPCYSRWIPADTVAQADLDALPAAMWGAFIESSGGIGSLTSLEKHLRTLVRSVLMAVASSRSIGCQFCILKIRSSRCCRYGRGGRLRCEFGGVCHGLSSLAAQVGWVAKGG